MKFLVILNDPPYGTERSDNGLRLAMSLSKRQDTEIRLFLVAIRSDAQCQRRRRPLHEIQLARNNRTVGIAHSMVNTVAEDKSTAHVHFRNMHALAEADLPLRRQMPYFASIEGKLSLRDNDLQRPFFHDPQNNQRPYSHPDSTKFAEGI